MTEARQWFNEQVTPYLDETTRQQRVPLWLEEKEHRATTIEIQVKQADQLEVLTLDLAGEPRQITTEERIEEPGVRITLEQNTLEQIQSGRLSGRAAYAEGLILTEGSRHLAYHLYQVLQPTFDSGEF